MEKEEKAENKEVVVKKTDVEIDTPTVYSNSVQLEISFYDFKLKFGEGGVGGVLNRANIIMSPQHTKALTVVLAKHLKDYENKFGEIKIPEDITESFKKG